MTHFWPFRTPCELVGGPLRDGLQQALEAAYWAGVREGSMAALLAVFVLGLIAWLVYLVFGRKEGRNGGVVLGLLSILVGIVLWYAQSTNAKSTPLPPALPSTPAQPDKPRPWRPLLPK